MKTTLYMLITGLLLTTFSCDQTSDQTRIAKTNQITTDDSKNTKHMLTNPTDKKLDYVIFGRFCGECGGECATMYKLDILNNKLLVDHTDSYWAYNRGTPMKFATTIQDKTKEVLATQILDNIPDFMLSSAKPTQTFGCPDCADGCGIYFEIKSDTTVNKFYIDYQPEQLQGEIKLFAEYVKNMIGKL